MNKLFQQMNKIEAEITAGLRDGTDGPGAAPDNEPRQVRAVASSKPSSADAGSEEMAKLRQQLKKAEARLREKIELCSDKDAQIAAVLAEGEALSKRQAEQEHTIRKLRLNIRDALSASEEQAETLRALREEFADTNAKLERAQAEVAEARRLRDAGAGPSSGPVGSTDGSSGPAGAPVAPADQTLALQRALRQAEAAEAREASLVASLTELQLENARLSQLARWRDEGLNVRLGELEARSGNAEALAGELAAAVARETQPLLKQVASLQSRLTQVQAAWKASEAELRDRLAQAEHAATAHGEESARYLSALAAAEAGLAQAREQAEAERVRLFQSRDAADKRASAEGRRAAHAEAEVVRVRHALERAEAAVLQGDQALEEARERGSLLAAELHREREASAEERKARAQQMHESRAQQVQARVQAGSTAGLAGGTGTDWRAAAVLQPTRATCAGASAAGGAGAVSTTARGAPLVGEVGGLRAMVAAMQDKEQTLIESLVELNLRYESLHEEAARMREGLGELRRLRDEHSMVLELLGEKEEKLMELEDQLHSQHK